VLLACLLGGEIEVFDRDCEAVASGPVQQADEGVPYLGVAVAGGAGQVVAEVEWFTDGVAMLVETPGGKVVGVGVDTGQAARAGRFQGD
jgi:hypothetical protein